MFFRLVFTGLLFLLTLPGFSQYRHLLNKSYAERYISLDTTFYNGRLLSRDSVSYFREVNKLADAARKGNDTELELEAELLRCEYFMFGNQSNHELFESRIIALKEVADQQGILPLQIRTRQKLGYYYFSVKHKYGPGFDNYLNSYQLLKNLPIEELPNKQELISNIGAAYYQFGDYENARKFLAEAWKTPPSYKKRLPINLTNTLGLIFREARKYDSAEYYFWKSFRMAQAIKDSTWMGIAAGNIGISYFYQKKFVAAIPLLQTDVRESLKANEIDNAVNSMLVLAKINLEQNDLAAAKKQVRIVKQLLPNTSDRYRHLKELYPILAKLSARQGDFARAYYYSDSAHFVKDSLFVRRNNMLASDAARKIEIEKHRADMQKLEAQEKLEVILRNSLLAGIVLLAFIAVLIINRQRLVHRQNQAKLEQEKDQIASELDVASQQLSDFTNHIREKNKLLEQFSAQIEKVKGLPDPEQQAHQETREKLLHSTILTDDQWEEFRLLFNKVHAGYLQRLREKLPTLSPAETRYFVLSKLNLTPKEMASMLGVRPDAIRLYRHRLRKKLNIEEDKALEELVNNV
jgi:Flp pilus assembly protein TadD/DNA-directed RNA polymerase specialized sigma24 family protein